MIEKSNRTLSATDLASAWYLGVSARSNIINVRGLVRSLRKKGLTRLERKEVIRNVSQSR